MLFSITGLSQVVFNSIGKTKLTDKIIIITSLSGQANKYLKVNGSGTGFEFGTVSGGPGDTTHFVAFSKVIGLVDSLLEKADITLLSNYLPLSVFDDSLLSYIAFSLGDDDSLVTGAVVIDYIQSLSLLTTSDIGSTVQGYNANTVIDAAYVHTDNNYTTAEQTKLSGIAAGAEVNINADWNAGSGDAQILNKPTIPTQYTDELAQDAVGAMLDANSLTYTDGTPLLEVKKQMSITSDASGIKLSGDATSPGNTMLYGTNGSGTKGWYAQPGGAATGVFDDLQISILQGDGNLAEASGVQTWAGSDRTTQDVFTVTANTTYIVEGRYYINTGSTTHTTALAWSTGATVTSFEYHTLVWAGAVNANITAQTTTHVTGVASKVVIATGTAVWTQIQFKGTLVIGSIAGGSTITPQINFSANPTGTCLMKRGSWISFTKIGTDTDILKGGWN